jgi:[protein-PII] uridylyltransferase
LWAEAAASDPLGDRTPTPTAGGPAGGLAGGEGLGALGGFGGAESWGGPSGGIALGGVGSLGSGDFGPLSDLDLVVVYEGRGWNEARRERLARALWYQIWDAGFDLDQSFRSLAECRRIASADLPAATGLLSLTPLAGDLELAERAASAVLTDWRGAARKRLPDLIASVEEREQSFGHLAYRLEPDLKEARGGLRDAVTLDALVASWLADKPRRELDFDGAREYLLDVRDALQNATRRRTSLLLMADQDAAARVLDPYLTADQLLSNLARAGRAVTYALDTTIRRAVGNLPGRKALPAVFVRNRRQGPRLTPLARGLAELGGEIVFAASGPGIGSAASAAGIGSGARPRAGLGPDRGRGPGLASDLAPGLASDLDPSLKPGSSSGPGPDLASPRDDPVLPLRAARVAAQTGFAFEPLTLLSLRDCPALPEPWPAQARSELAAYLACGEAIVPVWEDLDQAGLIARIWPEWVGVRNLVQRNALHRHTVDRHQVEAAAGLAALDLGTAPPELVAVATLFHDLGKRPGERDHPALGALLARPLFTRMGYDQAEVEYMIVLIRRHLTLPVLATSRDPDDPATVAALLEDVDHRLDLLDGLVALTEADARAAGPKAWTKLRATLIRKLAAGARAALTAG